MSKYKIIQLTNQDVGAVAAEAYMPLGKVSRKLNANTCSCETFNVSNTNSDVIYLNEPGYYNVTYSASLAAGAVGDIALSLIVNNTSVYTVTATAAEGDTYNVTLPYVVRVCPNSCSNPGICPASIQLQLGTTAVTGGTANLIIEKVF